MRIRCVIGAFAVAALLALPTGAAAKGAPSGSQITPLAAQQCATERADLGKKAFRKKYGAKHTMRTCAQQVLPQVNAAVPTANGDCADELAQIGQADFIDEYGVDASTPLADAMTECVAEDVDQILNPQDYVDGTTDTTDG